MQLFREVIQAAEFLSNQIIFGSLSGKHPPGKSYRNASEKNTPIRALDGATSRADAEPSFGRP